jgi:magnesium transporter
MKNETDLGQVIGQLQTGSTLDAIAAFEILPTQEAAQAAQRLPAQTAAAILTRLDVDRSAQILELMPQPTAVQILSAMEPDDRVHRLLKMPVDLHESLLSQMSAQKAAETRALEQYPPGTAGGIMTTHFTALNQNLTVEQAIADLRGLYQNTPQMFYVYVTDPDHRLTGVLSMRDLILAQPQSILRNVMIPNVQSVQATTDQEEVAHRMRQSRFLALPVVDAQSHLLGLITLDDVVDVIQEEATEDIQRMAGAGAEERLTSPWQLSFTKRIGWLQVNLATAFLAGAVVNVFGSTIGRFAVLAIYMPVVSGMGGNAAAQAMSVSIRGIAVGSAAPSQKGLLTHILHREAIVGFLTGLVVGITTAIVAWLWQYKHGVALGLIVASALVITQTLACISGAGGGFLMRKLGFDPAQSATIFATTVTDVTGLASLLGLATLLQSWLR